VKNRGFGRGGCILTKRGRTDVGWSHEVSGKEGLQGGKTKGSKEFSPKKKEPSILLKRFKRKGDIGNSSGGTKREIFAIGEKKVNVPKKRGVLARGGFPAATGKRGVGGAGRRRKSSDIKRQIKKGLGSLALIVPEKERG